MGYKNKNRHKNQSAPGSMAFEESSKKIMVEGYHRRKFDDGKDVYQNILKYLNIIK